MPKQEAHTRARYLYPLSCDPLYTHTVNPLQKHELSSVYGMYGTAQSRRGFVESAGLALSMKLVFEVVTPCL